MRAVIILLAILIICIIGGLWYTKRLNKWLPARLQKEGLFGAYAIDESMVHHLVYDGKDKIPRFNAAAYV